MLDIGVEQYRDMAIKTIDELILLSQSRVNKTIYVADISNALQKHFPKYDSISEFNKDSMCNDIMRSLLNGIEQTSTS